MKTYPATQLGFTLVEMIVSLALFTIVITISVGALLMLIGTNDQLQDEQSIMTNLSFALDSMTREIRTGTNYYCDTQNASTNAGPSGQKIFLDGEILDPDATDDCPEGRGSHDDWNYQGISFIESGQSITGSENTKIVYFYDRDKGKIYRRISGGDAESIVSSGVYITDAEFYVTGSTPLSEDSDEQDQASVTIFIEAREANTTDDSVAKPYRIQTSITQRTLDI